MTPCLSDVPGNVYSVQRLKTSEPFVPPNPNEFDSA